MNVLYLYFYLQYTYLSYKQTDEIRLKANLIIIYIQLERISLDSYINFQPLI